MIGKELTAIQQEHRLEKLQISRQLKNYKDKKYQLRDVILLQLSEQMENVLEGVIGMEYTAFVCSMLI